MHVRFGTPAPAVLLSCLLLALTGCAGAPEDGIARPRPRTPAYPVISAAFTAAFLDISRGGDVRRALDTAAGQIDRNLAAHRYYQPAEP